MNILRRIFKQKKQGSDFVKNWKPEDLESPSLKRAAQLGGVGAAGGAVVGLAAGGIAAKMAINKVPYQEATVDHLMSVKDREIMGYIPPDDYVSGSWRPSDDGISTKAVYRDNPAYDRDGSPTLRQTSTTFRGRGEAQPVEWSTEKIEHHKMNERDPYDYRTVEDNERYLSHYETVSKTRQVPYSATESYQDCSTSYNSDGSSSYDCDSRTRSVTKYRTEYYTDQEPVYKWRTVGHWQKYSPNIQSRLVGTVEKPNVDFDHGVNVGSYLLKGALFGAAIGAIAGGITAALEENFFPHTLPGYEAKLPKEEVPGQKTPIPSPEPPVSSPKPPVKKEPDCGAAKRHTHDNGDFRHSHASADRWHYHGCPDGTGFDEDVICFKPDQVPECYEDAAPLQSCDSNKSVCYPTKF